MLVRICFASILLSCSLLGASAHATSLLSSTYTAVWAAPDFFPLGTASFHVVDVRNETGHDASFDFMVYFREQLTKQLARNGSKYEYGETPETVGIELSIQLYQEGSTFGRWVGAAVSKGTAYVVVRAAFRKRNLPPVAELMTVSVINGGGLYSSGAEKTVLDDAAETIAAFLRTGEKK